MMMLGSGRFFLKAAFSGASYSRFHPLSPWAAAMVDRHSPGFTTCVLAMPRSLHRDGLVVGRGPPIEQLAGLLDEIQHRPVRRRQRAVLDLIKESGKLFDRDRKSVV